MSVPGLGAGGRIFAVGGGKGGVGKSLLATSLAVYLAQLGRRVVLVDADPTGANLHRGLGVELTMRRPTSPTPTEEALEPERMLLPTEVPGLRLLVAPPESSDVGGVKSTRKKRLLALLKSLGEEGPGSSPDEHENDEELTPLPPVQRRDDFVVNVGPGVSPSALDLFMAADVGIVVTVPEPPAIETTYRFVRALFVRELRRALRMDRTRLRVLDRIIAEFEPHPRPIDFVRHLVRVEPPIGEVALAMLDRQRLRLVVNQARVKSDWDLGIAMALLAHRRLGVVLDPVGTIEHDDAVWLAQRRRRPLLIDSPSSKAGRGLERIVRRVVTAPFARTSALVEGVRVERTDSPAALRLPPPPTFYDRLLVQRGASEEEIRRAYKRQREIYGGEGLATTALFSEEELSREIALLDEAHDILLDPPKRRAYDVSTFPDHQRERVPSPIERLESEAVSAELRERQAQLALEIGPDTEWTGVLLRRVRESRGIELTEVSGRTKIGVAHLTALEEEAFDRLPPLVYVRGFLVEVAKFYRLDTTQVARTYLRRVRDILEIRGS